MLPDEGTCWRAVESRDRRFDGMFFVAVATTGIYCRPSCPARPRRANVRFLPSAAAAQGAGYRACKRCRPDATPGSPEWNLRADVAGRAIRLVTDGVVDREGVAGLADRLGYTTRHLHRLLTAELGAGPQALARAQRAQTARILLETTGLTVSEVAFAAGFASLRQFNETIRQVFDATPTQLRAAAARTDGGLATPGLVRLRLAYREPFDWAGLLQFLAARAVPGVEEATAGSYRRSLALPHGAAVAELTPGEQHVRLSLQLTDLRDLSAAVARCRRLADLDADPVAVAGVLGADRLLAPLLAAAPGRRVPGHVDGAELAVRAVLGQQVSVRAARTAAARLVARFGKPLAAPVGGVTHLFPDMDSLAAADPAGLGLPAARARAVTGLATAVADGSLQLHPGADRDETRTRLLTLPGVGGWTADYVAMRGLGDPDVFLPTDLGVRRALRSLGADARHADQLAAGWRPWRSYSVIHLWEGNR